MSSRRATRERRRYLDRYRDWFTPRITKGLLLNVPFRRTARPLHSAGGATGLSNEVVDPDGTYQAWQDGLIRQAVNNTARIERLGVRAEGTRTNAHTRTEATHNAAWTKAGGATCSAGDDITAIGITLNKIVSDGTTYNRVEQTGPSVPDAGSVAVSVFAMQGIGGAPYIRIICGGANSRTFITWSGGVPSAGTPTDTGAITTQTPLIDYMGGGVYRIKIVAKQDTGAAEVVNVQYGVNWGAVSAGDYAYYGGYQAELGTSASSYIPTAAASVERAKDDLRFTNAAEVHCSKTAGTIICAVTPDYDAADLAAEAHIISAYTGAGAGTDGVRLLANASANCYSFIVKSGNANQAILHSSAIVPVKGETAILAGTWEVNDFKLYANGAQEAADAAGAVPTALGASLFIGQSHTNATQFFGTVEHLLIYDWKMPLDAIQVITREDMPRWIKTLSL